MPDDGESKVPEPAASAPSQEPTPEAPTAAEGQPTAPASGGRASLKNLRRQLNDDELSQSGVAKLLIESIERAEAECDRLRIVEEKFHAADKENGALNEKLKVNVALEILSGTGVGVGSAMIGLAPSLLTKEGNTTARTIGIVVGLALVLGSVIGRYVQVKK